MPQHKAPKPSGRSTIGHSRARGGSAVVSAASRQARQAATQSAAASASTVSTIPSQPSIVADHQRLLDLLASNFAPELADPTFAARLQEIKSLFFERKFLDIFAGTDPAADARLAVYSARYIPYRALAYLDLIRDVPELQLAVERDGARAVFLGGGAGSELAAFAYQRFYKPSKGTVEMATMDIGRFGTVLARLEGTLRESLNIPDGSLAAPSILCDLLSPAWPATATASDDAGTPIAPYIRNATVVTLFFTLNELFAQSDSKAAGVSFIQRLISSLTPGTLLVVADSAGSFSDLVIGSRTYKITVLLDMLPGLECVASDDARWFRFDHGLRYGAKLENMRYFARVYRRK
ncbi:hypothetical protein H9P43_009777 [Blastocladiella emersonii ATCC 22665]|nr:hypothetical protein H9P43_009777 [Blastocladiella emersonii ATCC 22665]